VTTRPNSSLIQTRSYSSRASRNLSIASFALPTVATFTIRPRWLTAPIAKLANLPSCAPPAYREFCWRLPKANVKVGYFRTHILGALSWSTHCKTHILGALSWSTHGKSDLAEDRISVRGLAESVRRVTNGCAPANSKAGRNKKGGSRRSINNAHRNATPARTNGGRRAAHDLAVR